MPSSILLVSEDASLASILHRSLKNEGFDARVVKGANEAHSAIGDGAFDLVIASQMLAGMDGVAFCKKLKADRPKMPLLLLGAVTGAAGVADVRKVSGADSVLPRGMTGDMFLAEVRRLTKSDKADARGSVSGPRPAAAPRMATNPGRPVPAEAPSLAGGPETPIDPVFLYGQAVIDRMSGTLRLVHSGVERIIWFDGGTPVAAESTVPEERLGAIAVARSLIGPDELERFRALARKNGVRLYEVLKKNDVVTNSEKDGLRIEQARMRITGAFAWTAAFVEQKPDAVKAEDVIPGLPIAPILMEGLRRFYDESRLAASLHRVLGSDRVLIRSAHADALVPTFFFDPHEAAAFAAVDGSRTAGAILAASGLRIAAMRALVAGLALRLVAPR